MRKPTSIYVSNPKDPEAWLTPDFLIERERTRKSYNRAVQAIEKLASNGTQFGVKSDWQMMVPNWEMNVGVIVAMFWFGHEHAVERPRLVAKDARIFQKHLANFQSAIENLPTPLWRAFDVGASDSVQSLTEEISIRLKALNAICDVTLEDKKTASRADTIGSAVCGVKVLFEKIVGRRFKGNLRLVKLRANATNAEKRDRQFESFDAFFVQTVMRAIDPDVTAHQIRHALRPKDSQG